MGVWGHSKAGAPPPPFLGLLHSGQMEIFEKLYCQATSLMKFYEEMRHAMDHSEVAALILMDLSKAFDCLPHDLMAAKLTAYGMSHSAIKLLVNYLHHCK